MSNREPAAAPSWTYDQLLKLLSVERLGSYLTAAGHDVDRAFELYEWSMRAAAEVMHTTGMVEVIIRNALDRHLSDWADRRGPDTWLDSAPLDERGRGDIQKARERATRHGRIPEVHGKVIAELSFGFWRFIVARRYLTSLWVPAIHAAFPHSSEPDLGRRQEAVDGVLKELNFIRNRAAHHEPVHTRDLGRDLRLCVELANWVDPTAGAWIEDRSRLSEVLAQRPR